MITKVIKEEIIKTKKMEFETTGKIQTIRKDQKAVEIMNNWYNSFKPIENINKEDNVKILFTEVKKNDKIFKNIKSIEKLNNEPKWAEKIDSNYKEPIEYPGELLEYKKPISDTTINCILMQSVQHSLNKGYALDKATYEVIQAFNKIKESY